ncbi:MAG: sulfotransferase family 2 domain-containing protein [Halioglobus sp.]|nr:sulfotransferase family 2 domain-containing protein [Halioglobus sp.]
MLFLVTFGFIPAMSFLELQKNGHLEHVNAGHGKEVFGAENSLDMGTFRNWIRERFMRGLKNLKRHVKDRLRSWSFTPDTRVAVWKEHHLLYVRIPKCANTSIRNSIEGAEVQWMRNRDIRALDASWVSFSFVRNPWARLVSTFRDKASLGSRSARMEAGVFQGFIDAGISVYPNMGFAEFCAAVCAIPDAKTDKHLRSQSSFLFPGGQPLVRVIGKVETMQADWVRVMQHAGLDFELRHLNRTQHCHYSKYYDDPGLVNLVGDRYADDVRNFNYQFERH